MTLIAILDSPFRYLAHTSNFNPIKPLGGTSSLADAVKPNQQAGAAESKGVWRSRTLETLSNLLLTQAQQEQAEVCLLYFHGMLLLGVACPCCSLDVVFDRPFRLHHSVMVLMSCRLHLGHRACTYFICYNTT